MTQVGNTLRNKSEHAGVFAAIALAAVALSGCANAERQNPNDNNLDSPSVGRVITDPDPKCTKIEITGSNDRSFAFAAVGQDYDQVTEDRLDYTEFTFGDGTEKIARDGVVADHTYSRGGEYQVGAKVVSKTVSGTWLETRLGTVMTLPCPPITVHVPTN